MCQWFYKDVATWTKVDQRIGRALLRNVEEYIVSTQAREGLPKATWFFHYVRSGYGQNPTIDAEWKNDEMLQDMLREWGIKKTD
jgi:hypothetical protein